MSGMTQETALTVNGVDLEPSNVEMRLHVIALTGMVDDPSFLNPPVTFGDGFLIFGNGPASQFLDQPFTLTAPGVITLRLVAEFTFTPSVPGVHPQSSAGVVRASGPAVILRDIAVVLDNTTNVVPIIVRPHPPMAVQGPPPVSHGMANMLPPPHQTMSAPNWSQLSEGVNQIKAMLEQSFLRARPTEVDSSHHSAGAAVSQSNRVFVSSPIALHPRTERYRKWLAELSLRTTKTAHLSPPLLLSSAKD